MSDDTFWLAITYETILALAEDYPVAAEIVAAQVAILIPEASKQLGSQPKDGVRAHYRRQRELAMARCG